MIIAQISDMHIQQDRRLLRNKFDNAASLERCIAQLNALKPDAVIATGDLVHTGMREEYGMLRELLAPLQPPLFLMPGNHDSRALMQEFFPSHDYLHTPNERLNHVVELNGLRLYMLDSLIAGSDEGNVGEAQLTWLEAHLAVAPDQPSMIALHHPPFATGLRYIDDHFCADGPALGRLVARFPSVLRVMSGHLHRSIQVNFGGTIGCVCPSTAVTFGLSFAPKSGFFRSDEPPGYYLHVWAPGKPVITHMVQLTPAALTPL